VSLPHSSGFCLGSNVVLRSYAAASTVVTKGRARHHGDDYQSNLPTFRVTFASLFTLADPAGAAETALKPKAGKTLTKIVPLRYCTNN
jgi:hypothetical protein